MNKKIIRISLIIITLFMITISVYALNPNDYINKEVPQEETQEEQNTTEEEQKEEEQAPQEEQGNKISIIDSAFLFKWEEETQIRSRVKALNEKGHIAIVSVGYNRKTTEEYAEEYYMSKFNNETGILILYDRSNDKVLISAKGDLESQITPEVQEEIINEALPLVSEKKYYESLLKIISQLEEKLGIESKNIEEQKNNHTLVIEDDALLLTQEEKEKLKTKMEPLTKYGHIVFKSISINPKGSTANFANDYYYSKFGNESGTVFLIDMDNRIIYIVSAGENYKYITKRKAEIITDNIYKYASRKEYYECAEKAYEQMGIVLEGGKIAEPMRHASNIVIAIVIAFFVNYFIVAKASKLKKATENEVLKNCDIEFTAGDVSGAKTGSHSVYSPPSSSSGGGHSSGGGGGGFSGGGGGHRF